ncbi:cupin domain-containing protein [Actinomycetospora flava]|uniref:Cupin domain-containing protein n=1 Tax=Actinomycetospora flava TaxID=3129232 RepID=A0ABU8M9C8_9PSEU
MSTEVEPTVTFESADPGGRRAPIEFVAARAGDLPVMTGRRDWMEYHDHGVTEATGGRMRAQRTKINNGYSEVTGWHYHVCSVQWIYVVQGWQDLQLEDGTTLHMEVGDSALIPGGYRHNEVGMSHDLDVLEISVPAKMGTVPCEAPSAWAQDGAEHVGV